MMLDTPPLDPRKLRDAFGRFATGVTVVTMLDGEGRPTGVTVNSFSSLSLDPPLCLFSLGKKQMSTRWLQQEGVHFTVNILTRDQEKVAWQFARPLEDKFEGVETGTGKTGIPYLHNSLCHFECRLWARYDGGDHEIYVGEILHLDQLAEEADPVLFYRGAMTRLSP